MRALFVMSLALIVLVGCAAEPTRPQPILPTSPLVIDASHGPVRFTVELAASSETQESGLMFRRTMAPDHGMLFDFHRPLYVSFWMKNTILPLDMVFILSDGTVTGVAANAVPYSTKAILSDQPVRAVLEINAGLGKALGIVPGSRVHHAIFGDPPSAP